MTETTKCCATSRRVRCLLWLFAASFLAAPLNSLAGFPSGPYYVWADLTGNVDSSRNRALREYLKSEPGNEFCGDSADHWIVYGHKRPEGFGDALIAKTLTSRDAQRRLVRLMKDFRDQGIEDGLDGVVFYTEVDGPKMVSIDAHGLLRKEAVIHPDDAQELMKKFCRVAPPSYRR